jgi:hypothetical protein
VKRYTDRQQTVYDHAWEIRDAYKYHAFEDPAWGRKFRTFLHGRAWTQAEGPVALFDHAVVWLRRERVLLPGVTVLAKLVAEVREKADERLHATVTNAARRRDPRVRVDQVPPNRMKVLARVGAGSKAPALARMYDPKRTAVLVAEARHLQAVAIDDALDLFALLTVQPGTPSHRRPAAGYAAPAGEGVKDGRLGVEVAQNLPGVVAVRDSKDPHGPVLAVAPDQWRAFTDQVKAGAFDLA